MIETNMKSYFGKKDLLHSKTSALSSRSSGSPISRSTSSDKYLGYSLITNDSCVATHRARVFAVATVTCITAVSLVIVIIVMTVTNNEADTKTDKDKQCHASEGCPQESSCHDYIIVGGGLAGAYAAWILHTNKSVQLFEASGRIGGNLQTQTFPFLSDIKLEVGIPYFMHGIHRRTETLIKDLGLEVRPYYGSAPEEQIHYFTRGDKTNFKNLNSNILKRYRLSQKEVDLMQQLTGSEKTVLSTPALHLFTKEMQSSMLYLSNGVFDSQQSVQSTLLKGASTEGYNCMRDHSRQMDFLEEANARQFIELLNDMENEKIDIHHHTLTLTEGMQSLPRVLVEETLKDNANFKVHLDHKLIGISKMEQKVLLKFNRALPARPANAQILQEEVNVCADHVILDLTPTQIREVELPFPVPDIFDAIQPTKGLVIYLMFNGTLYPDVVTNGTFWMYTDTPLGDISIIHAKRNVTIEAMNVSTTTSYPDHNATMDDLGVNSTMLNVSTNQTSAAVNISSTKLQQTTTEASTTVDHHHGNESQNASHSNVTTPLPETSESPAMPRYELHPVTVIQAVFTLQGSYYDYWQSLLKQGIPLADVPGSITDTALIRLKVHLEQVMHRPIHDSDTPILSGFVYNLTDDWPSASLSYPWKPGYDWSTQSSQLLQPDSGMNVFVVGQPYAHSFYSLGVEGHLSTVDDLVSYLETKVSVPSPN